MRFLFSWPALISLSIAIAFSVGHVMQSMTNYPSAQHEKNTVAFNDGKLILSNVAFTAATNDDLLAHNISDPLTALRGVLPRGFTAPDRETVPALALMGCHATVTSAVGPMATIDLSISSDCAPGTAFEIHHNGMIISHSLDQNGGTVLTIPALAKRAVVIVALPDQSPKVISHDIPEFDTLQRSVLQWYGSADLGLISQDANQTLATFRLGERHRHQSIVVSVSESEQVPDLNVVAHQSPALCNALVDFQFIQFTSDRAPNVRDFANTQAQCSDKNQILVLKNLYQDATVARK